MQDSGNSSRRSPTLEGFRAAFHAPSITLAEVTWRWAVGIVGAVVLAFGSLEFLGSLPVSGRDAGFLRIGQPLLAARALSHILRGSLNRAVLASFCAVLALSLFWILAASFGRSATVRSLLDYFRSESDLDPSPANGDFLIFRSLLGLQFLRIASSLAAVLASSGAVILAGIVLPSSRPHPGLSVIIFLLLAGSIYLVWSGLNWWLSISGIFAVRDGAATLDALSAAVTFSQENATAVLAVSAWSGFAHAAAFIAASVLTFIPLALVHVVPDWVIVVTFLLMMLGYFAIVDWLYIARLAGYVYIAGLHESPASPERADSVPPVNPPFAPRLSPQTAVDRDEPILSDLPHLYRARLI